MLSSSNSGSSGKRPVSSFIKCQHSSFPSCGGLTLHLSSLLFSTDNQLDSEQELSFLYAAKRRIPMLMGKTPVPPGLGISLLFSRQSVYENGLHKIKLPFLAFLDAIDKDGFEKNEHSTLMGYLMGYLCIISGHRSVVLTSMTKEHVANADQWNNGTRFQVLVSSPSSFSVLAYAAMVLDLGKLPDSGQF